MKKFGYIFLALLLSSCMNTWNSAKEGVKQDSYKNRQKVADFVYPEGKYLVPAVTTYEYSYCYKSWADVTCYSQPVPGQEELRVGSE